MKIEFPVCPDCGGPMFLEVAVKEVRSIINLRCRQSDSDCKTRPGGRVDRFTGDVVMWPTCEICKIFISSGHCSNGVETGLCTRCWNELSSDDRSSLIKRKDREQNMLKAFALLREAFPGREMESILRAMKVMFGHA